MSKVASVIFPNAAKEYKVQYFDKDENAIQMILDFVRVHHCRVVLLHGFTEEEINLLENVDGVTVNQYD